MEQSHGLAVLLLGKSDLGKTTFCHPGDMCLGAEGKKDPLYETAVVTLLLAPLLLRSVLTSPVKCQLKRYLNVGIRANLLLLNELLPIALKLVGDKVQISD